MASALMINVHPHRTFISSRKKAKELLMGLQIARAHHITAQALKKNQKRQVK
jgi:hypothetical protein